jgi:hypothetical protein
LARQAGHRIDAKKRNRCKSDESAKYAGNERLLSQSKTKSTEKLFSCGFLHAGEEKARWADCWADPKLNLPQVPKMLEQAVFNDCWTARNFIVRLTGMAQERIQRSEAEDANRGCVCSPSPVTATPSYSESCFLNS